MVKRKDNVVSIDGKPLNAPKANRAVIQALGQEIERAKSGEIIGVAIARYHHDGSTGFAVAGQFRPRVMAGAVLDLLDEVRKS